MYAAHLKRFFYDTQNGDRKKEDATFDIHVSRFSFGCVSVIQAVHHPSSSTRSSVQQSNPNSAWDVVYSSCGPLFFNFVQFASSIFNAENFIIKESVFLITKRLAITCRVHNFFYWTSRKRHQDVFIYAFVFDFGTRSLLDTGVT